MISGEKLGFALVGCGSISRKYCRVIIDLLEQARLVAVCDLDSAKSQSYGEQFGVLWFTDIHKMMAQIQATIDVVCILTPSGCHCQNVLEIAEYGKHICVEKPLALTLADADRMIQACQSSGSKLFVVHQNRFNVPVQKLCEALQQGRFGQLVLGTIHLRWYRPQSYYDQQPWRGTWAADGGVFANQCYHFIDLLQWLMGDVRSVIARGTTRIANIETEDTGIILLRFQNGALGRVEATTATISSTQKCSLTVLGDHGTVEIGGFAANELKVWNFEDTTGDDEFLLAENCCNPPNFREYGHFKYLQSVIASVLEDKPAATGGAEGRKTLELISAIYESIVTGSEVYLGADIYQSPLGTYHTEGQKPSLV